MIKTALWRKLKLRSTLLESILFYFIINGFLGFLLDTAYCSIYDGEFILGGMFKSVPLPIPFSVIFAFGSLSLILLAQAKIPKQYLILEALLVGIIATIVEYIGGTLTLWMLGHRAWDYSHFQLNLHGHINVWYSLGWIIVGLIFMNVVYPPERCVAKKLFIDKHN